MCRLSTQSSLFNLVCTLACDGVDVQIAAQYDMMELMAKYDLNQNFNLMTISDIQDKVIAREMELLGSVFFTLLFDCFLQFTYSFATEREIVNC